MVLTQSFDRSTDDRAATPARPDRSGHAGFSMIEVIIASTLLFLMIMAVGNLSVSGADAQEYARRITRATEITQDVVDQMRLELVSCVRLFGNDAEGNGNLAVFDLDGAPAPLAGVILPTVDSTGSIEADTATRQITGNSLFFAKLSWTDRFVCSSSNEYLVDVYRWVYYYLTPEDGGPQVGSPIGLNLVRIESEPMVDGTGLDRITDPLDQAELCLHLLQGTPDATGVARSPVQVVWLRGGDPTVAGTFRQIDDVDGSLSATPTAPRPDPWEVLRRQDEVRGILSYRHHSIATVFARDTVDVTRFAIQNASGLGFPHGFETQIVGPSSARQVLLHLVVASTNRRGHTAYANMQMVVDARDL